MICESIKHILCPIDFSVESDTALLYAEYLANKFGARVTVIHAERFEVPLEFTSAQIDGLVAEMKKLKKDVTHHLRSYVESRHPLLGANYKVIENSAVEAILDEIETQHIDFVVMGTTGKSGIKRFTIGSVADGVTREAKIPVLIIGDKSHGPLEEPKLERILVPVNYTKPIVDSLKTASCFAQITGAELLITHIVETDDYDENTAKEQLCKWVPEQTQEKCHYDTAVRKGNAAEQIIQLAADEHADMVVIAAVHRPFLETTIIGTTSERVMRHASCPVLVVPVRS